ncbi:PAS domain S-box protein [Paenibacillus sp. sgz302251]|uniref:PAS domain S-box protein n=1 Tax=Paenibacillus sp. sgz302251 TaxID=3414493 RepID=UPI003C7EA153
MDKLQIDHHTFFEQLYTRAPIGIALVSIDGSWIKVNPMACKILGYTEEELKRLTFRDISHPDELEKNNDLRKEALDGGSSFYEMEKRYIQKNGNMVWTGIHVALVRDETLGAPLYFLTHIVDISEKKNAELELLEYRELFKLISENVLDLITYITPDGVTRYVSPSIRELLGYEPEEVIGKANFELYHPDDLKVMQATTYADNDLFSCRVRHKNGNYIWFETTIKTIRDEHGNVQKVLGIARDITERKNYEDNLAEAQQIASLGSWEWDILQNKVTLSDQCYKIFSLDKKNLISNDELIHLIHPEDQQRYLDCFAQAMKGNAFDFEFRNLQPDESVKYLHIRLSVKFDEIGTPVKVIGTTQEITERKKAELKLEESIERYTSLKKYNHDAIISLDLEGNIINTNPVAEQLTGYRVKEMVSLSISTFIGVDNLSKLRSDTRDLAAIERNIDKINHKDGHQVEVLTTIAPIIINKQSVGYYIIAKDITEQKKLLIEKETAERMNQTKSAFLAMMSHEIRTPMNGVIGMTDLLLETTELDEQQKEYADIIKKSGDKLLTLINDILDISKIESGKTALNEEPFNMRDCITETIELLSPKVREKKLEMTVTVSPEVPQHVTGDSNRLRQVLINVIGNAIKFTYSGSVAISVQNKICDHNQVQIQFTIKDTGIGIPQEQRQHLFEPFYQAEHFMTRNVEGTGLGLAISKRLIELMGGNIWVEPADGPGAVFVFTANFWQEIQRDAVREDASDEGNQGETKSLKILIAEDNRINQLVLQKMLKKLGYDASIAANGKEVIQTVAYETYDMIFMDIQMPEMSGVEATKVIRETLKPEGCPYIIAVTANALKGDRERYLAEGMDNYMSKPLTIDAVSDMLVKFHQFKNKS